jgi:hypothetical protein
MFKIQLDTILTLIVFVVSTILTKNPFVGIALALGFAKGWDMMHEKRMKKEEEESKKRDTSLKSVL